MFFSDQIDRAAAKAAARHARTVNAFNFPRQLDHQIELVAADFIIVAQALVRLGHEFPKLVQITSLERISRRQHARVLSYDMPATSINYFRKARAMLLELLHRYIP